MGVLRQAVTRTASFSPVLTSLLVLVLDGQGESVQVAGFLGYDAELRRSFSIQAGDHLQLCALLRPEAVQLINTTTLMSLNTQSFHIIAEMDTFRLQVQVNSNKFKVNQELAAERWTRLCLGVLPADTASKPTDPPFTSPTTPFPMLAHVVWVAVGDHVLNVTEIENYPLSLLSGTYSFGNALVPTSFVGFVAAISTDPVIVETPPTNTSCSDAVSESESFSFWHRDNSVFFTEMEEQQVCSEQMHEITLYGPHGYVGFRRMCSSLGGQFPEVEEMVAWEVNNHNCVTEEGIVSWLRGDGEEGEHVWPLCPALLVNGTTSQRLCVQDLPCIRCLVPSTHRYSLYGPVQDFDRQYSLRMLPDGSFYFEGRDTSNISRLDDGWTLWSRLHHRWWRLGQGAWPLGRRPWYSPHLNATLAFTSCSALQFPADDGTCLLRTLRCDSNNDHSDGSDERACFDRLISKTRDYSKNMDPSDGQEFEKIEYSMRLINIGEITAAQGMASIEMNLVSKWHDNRLRFVDVRRSMSKLYVFPCEDIWTPELYLKSGYISGSRANFSCIFNYCQLSLPSLLDQEVNVSDPLVGWVTNGDDVTKLVMATKIEVSSACHFRLSRYPFGRYTCNTSVLAMGPSYLIKWKGRFEELPYSGNSDLSDFHLDKVTLEPHDENYTIILTLHLSGLADYHLLASFSPSGLMFVICYSTLRYPIENFNERVMVSLTSLLVLVVLFSQTTAIVKTSYYKLLDVWYVVLIALCFFVVISNAVVHVLQCRTKDEPRMVPDNDDENDSGGKQRVIKHAVWCNKMCKVFLFFIFVVLIIVCVLIAKEYL